MTGDRAHLRLREAPHDACRSASRSSELSESTKATTAADVARMPAAIAARLPRFSGKAITRTEPVPRGDRSISRRVLSVEPSLMTTISSFSRG